MCSLTLLHLSTYNIDLLTVEFSSSKLMAELSNLMCFEVELYVYLLYFTI